MDEIAIGDRTETTADIATPFGRLAVDLGGSGYSTAVLDLPSVRTALADHLGRQGCRLEVRPGPQGRWKRIEWPYLAAILRDRGVDMGEVARVGRSG